MRTRSRVFPAQVGLLLSLGLVLAAFSLPLSPAPPEARRVAPAPLHPDLLLELPPTAHTASRSVVLPSALPPVEVPDAVMIEEVVETIPLPVLDDVEVRTVVPPLPPDPPTIELPPDPLIPDEGFIEVPHVMPAIVGGLAAFQQTVEYPRFCRAAGIEGRVMVRFIVGTDGSVSDVEVLRGIGGGCDEAAVEAIRAARFTPGIQRGRPVRVRMALPVTFRLR